MDIRELENSISIQSTKFLWFRENHVVYDSAIVHSLVSPNSLVTSH